MRKLLFTFFISFLFLTLYSQNIEYEYFNKKWKPTSEKRAVFIRKTEKINETLYKVMDYDKYSNVLMKGEYSSISPMVENGYFEFFDSFDFSKVAIGYYKDGVMVGDWHFTNYLSSITRTVNYDIELIKNENKQTDNRVLNPDVMPKFRNKNIESFRSYIDENLIYPPIAQKYKIEENVFLQFDIDAKGNICNIKVYEKVNKDLEREAIRVVSQSGEWSPGMQNGEPVKVRFTFPVIFLLL